MKVHELRQALGDLMDRWGEVGEAEVFIDHDCQLCVVEGVRVRVDVMIKTAVADSAKYTVTLEVVS